MTWWKQGFRTRTDCVVAEVGLEPELNVWSGGSCWIRSITDCVA